MGEENQRPARWSIEPETQALRRLQTAMSEAEVALGRRMNLGHSELAAMTHLSTRAAPVGPGWLSQRLGVTPAAATELVDRLERAGHLERQRDTADRRRVHLIPTERALDEVGGQLAPLLGALDQAATQFSAGERAAIQRFLADLIAAYAEFANDRPPRDSPGLRRVSLPSPTANEEHPTMSDLNSGDAGAPDTPEKGDVDTTSMYGTVPDETPGDELGTSEEEQLGTEENLTTPATGGLPEG